VGSPRGDGVGGMGRVVRVMVVPDSQHMWVLVRVGDMRMVGVVKMGVRVGGVSVSVIYGSGQCRGGHRRSRDRHSRVGGCHRHGTRRPTHVIRGATLRSWHDGAALRGEDGQVREVRHARGPGELALGINRADSRLLLSRRGRGLGRAHNHLARRVRLGGRLGRALGEGGHVKNGDRRLGGRVVGRKG